MADFDPIPSDAQFSGDSLLERVARAHEDAVDAYGNACDSEALAENEYLRLFQTAWVHAVEDGVPATTRAKHCDNAKDVMEARLEFNRASAGVKRTKAKADELSHRLMAVMAHQRFVREGT